MHSGVFSYPVWTCQSDRGRALVLRLLSSSAILFWLFDGTGHPIIYSVSRSCLSVKTLFHWLVLGFFVPTLKLDVIYLPGFYDILLILAVMFAHVRKTVIVVVLYILQGVWVENTSIILWQLYESTSILTERYLLIVPLPVIYIRFHQVIIVTNIHTVVLIIKIGFVLCLKILQCENFINIKIYCIASTVRTM